MKLYEGEEYIYHKIPIRIFNHTLEQEGIYSPLHWHRSIELDLAVKGRIQVTVSGETREMQTGDWIIVNSGELHSFTWIERDDSYDGFTLLIAKPFIDEWLGCDCCLAFPQNPEDAQQIYDALVKISETPESDERTFEAERMEDLFRLIKLLGKYCLKEPDEQSRTKAGHIEHIKNIINYIDEHYKENISLNSVAEKFHYAPAHLSRLFKEHIGYTFYVYLQDIRLLNTMEQLKKSKDISLTDCALKNGFPNVKSFITTFKKHYQCTPSEWRRRKL